MTLEYVFQAMSGTGHALCHWLAYRFEGDEGYRPETGDCWIGHAEGSRLTSSLVHAPWITDLYQTETRVWATEAMGHVFMNPSLGLSSPWEFSPLKGVLRGVWGLNDDNVFAWGLHAGKPVAFHYEGSSWREVTSPGYIIRVHGCASDLIYAVGTRGLVARWNGHDAFEQMPCDAHSTLGDVYVVSGDEMYAVGHGGELMRGTTHGWEKAGTHSAGLLAICHWQGDIWVGGFDGLHKLEDEALTTIKPDMRPLRFDSRGELLITQPTHMIHSLDGEKFRTIGSGTFEKVTTNREPMWR